MVRSLLNATVAGVVTVAGMAAVQGRGEYVSSGTVVLAGPEEDDLLGEIWCCLPKPRARG